MSKDLGVIIIYGIEFDIDSDEVYDFIRNQLQQTPNISPELLENFDECFECFLNGKEYNLETRLMVASILVLMIIILVVSDNHVVNLMNGRKKSLLDN